MSSIIEEYMREVASGQIPLPKMSSLMKGTIVIHARKVHFWKDDCEYLLKKMSPGVAPQKKKNKKAELTIFNYPVPGGEDPIDISERDVFSELQKERFVAQMKDITLNERCKYKPGFEIVGSHSLN